MRYAGIIFDDTAAAPGLCLSFYTQGCPLHCPGCHNPETWDPDRGHEFTGDTMNDILNGIKRNGIKRSFAVLGGEPLAQYNQFLTAMVVQNVRQAYPGIKIWLWTGFSMDHIMNSMKSQPHIKIIFNNVDAIVAGPYIEAERDISLAYRGSRNQIVWHLDHEKNIWYNEENDKRYDNV